MSKMDLLSSKLNPKNAVDTYCGLKNLAATLVSRFWSNCIFRVKKKSATAVLRQPRMKG